MSPRSPLILTSLFVALLLPAAAQASDPLLSGYAGPGGGEQVVLGGATVGGGGGTSGGSGATAAAAGADESLRATPNAGAVAPSPAGELTSRTQRRKTPSPSPSASRPKSMSNGATTPSTTSTPTASAGAPALVAYPTRAGEVSSLPVSAGGLLLVLVAFALLVLSGLGLRRLSAGSEDAPSRPQVSAS